jgi:hypothetical protein
MQTVVVVIVVVLTVCLGSAGLFLFSLYFLLAIFAYRKIRLRGYFPIAAAMLVLSVYIAALLALISTILLLPRPNNFWQTLGEILICMGVTFAVPALGCAVLVRKLPKRDPRVFGPRVSRFPFVSLGYLVIAGTIVGVVALIIINPAKALTSDNLNNLTTLLFLFVGGGAILVGTGKRIRNPVTIEGLTKSDARLPVLFLRPFAAESNAFVKGPASEYKKYLTAVKSWGTKEDEDFPVSISFEEYLGSTFQARVGPFVALGNPQDYLPPEGAVRTYADDEGWYEYFQRLAGRACMVMPVSNSDNLQRELTFIRREGLQRRLFILTDLIEVPRGFFAWLFKPFPWIFLQLLGPPRTDEKASWRRLAEKGGNLGFDFGDDPGRGGVITFDLDGKAKILVRGAKTPAEFIEPIREYLVGTLGMDLGEVSAKNEGPQVVALQRGDSALNRV